MAPKHPCFFWGEVVGSYRNPAIQVTSWDSMWKQPLISTVISFQILPRHLLGGSLSQDLFQWLITITLVSPQDLGLFWTPFHSWPKFRAYKLGGWPDYFDYLRVLGWSAKILAVWKTPGMTLRLRTNHVDEFLFKRNIMLIFFQAMHLGINKRSGLAGCASYRFAKHFRYLKWKYSAI